MEQKVTINRVIYVFSEKKLCKVVKRLGNQLCFLEKNRF